jgi:hypothetical protein
VSAAYVLLCDAEDYTITQDPESGVQTGTCAAPYYGPLPTMLPEISITDGLMISGAIGAVWAIGVYARLLIRAGQQEYQRP